MRLLVSIFALSFVVATAFGQQNEDQVKETVNKDKIAGHIYFLADDLLQGRETGTPGNKIAASYIANQLRAYGAQPIPETNSFYQPVAMELVYPPRQLTLNVNGNEIRVRSPWKPANWTKKQKVYSLVTEPKTILKARTLKRRSY